MTSEAAPKPGSDAQHGPGPDPAEFAHWLHRLRNEINTVTMASAAASGLVEAGAADDPAVRDNLRRVRDACRRCSALLAEPPAGN
ncbi:hypothetical protein K4L06_17755 [Lysobacter sp. BMK333-48F3]|uniref:hypothetical protein n=1 Tax=Lysobacter sp. BMK333-48F3 TaxID=2867962 RepID=UPI001C8C5CDD|nr:hypothetical protein [Lysobacter sp. BMK333-48F3]MBX9403158.1 hypothetical protein [Lysobacter sp. BMK333-48F3]